MKVSVFNNATENIPTTYISIPELVDILGEEKLKERTIRYREIIKEAGKDHEVAQQFKKGFQAFSACELSLRRKSEDNIINYHGYVIIDIDDVTEVQIEQLKTQLKQEDHVVLYYTSVSGQGLKVVHQTLYNEGEDVDSHHENAFENFRQFYLNRFSVQIDESGKDYTRMSFISYDKEVYYNDKHYPIKLNPLIVKNVITQATSSKVFQSNDVEVILNDIHEYLRKHNYTIGDSYNDWLALCFGLKHELEDVKAREWFHQLSSLNHKLYNKENCDKQFDGVVIDRDKTYTLGTIIYMAQQLGYKLPAKILATHGFQIKKQLVEYMLEKKGIKLRFNLLKDELEIKKQAEDWQRFSDVDLNYIYLDVLNNTFEKNKTYDVLTTISPMYDPVKAFVQELPKYDGSNYIEQLAKTITYDCDEVLAEMMLRKWLVGFVGMLSDPLKCVNENILVLQGGQGIGKTRFFRKLAEPFKEYFTAKNINPNSKDDKFLIAENFLILFDEMENMVSTKSNTEAFKALMSEKDFIARRPYGRVAKVYERIASFAGTINKTTFIKDITGSRRFFVLPCEAIDYQHTIDVEMIYAEALHLYNNGFQYYLSEKEQAILAEHNEVFKEELLEEELLKKWIESDSSNGMNTTEILQGLKEREGDLINCKVAFIGRLLNSMGYKRKTINGRKAYPVKFKEVQSNYKIVIPKDKVVSLF